MQKYKVRFNKTRGNPGRGTKDHVWRVFEGDKEYLVKNLKFNTQSFSEMDESGVDWNVCCYGQLTFDKDTSTAIFDNPQQNDRNQFLLEELRLGKNISKEWYYWRLSNNYERAVFLKGDPVLPREAQRYEWAAKNLEGDAILEIGCSTGYGSQFFPQDKFYLGLDYDPIIVNIALEQNWGSTRMFAQADINTLELAPVDTIIAFEVIEHLDNGLAVVEKLKKYCKRLLITVPYDEPKGFWGEHHKLHGLTEKDFPGFKFEYINFHGNITDTMQPIDSTDNLANLMICRWDNV